MAQGTRPGEPLSERDLSLLSAYLDGELSEAERARLEARLRTDSALQAELDSLRQTVTLVRSLPQIRPPRNFTLDPAQYGRRAPGPRWLVVAAPLVAAGASLLIVAVCAGVLLTSGVRGGQQFRPAAAPLGEAESLAAEEEAPAEEEAAFEAPAAEEAPAEEEAAAAEAGAAVEEEAAAEALPEVAPTGSPALPLAQAPETANRGGEGEAPPEGGAAAGAQQATLTPEAMATEEEMAADMAGESLPTPTASSTPQPTQVAEQAAPPGEDEGITPPPQATPLSVAPAPQEAGPSGPPLAVVLAIGIAAVLGVGLLVAGLVIALVTRRR